MDSVGGLWGECGACSRSVVVRRMSAPIRGSEIVGGKQYSSRNGSTRRTGTEKAGGEERRDESCCLVRDEGIEDSQVKMVVEQLREN